MPRTGDRRTATGEFGYIYPRPQPLLGGGGVGASVVERRFGCGTEPTVYSSSPHERIG